MPPGMQTGKTEMQQSSKREGTDYDEGLGIDNKTYIIDLLSETKPSRPSLQRKNKIVPAPLAASTLSSPEPFDKGFLLFLFGIGDTLNSAARS